MSFVSQKLGHDIKMADFDHSYTSSVADPGFPVRGHGPVRGALFGKNVCENERIGSRRGGMLPARPPRSANVVPNLCLVVRC